MATTRHGNACQYVPPEHRIHSPTTQRWDVSIPAQHILSTTPRSTAEDVCRCVYKQTAHIVAVLLTTRHETALNNVLPVLTTTQTTPRGDVCITVQRARWHSPITLHGCVWQHVLWHPTFMATSVQVGVWINVLKMSRRMLITLRGSVWSYVQPHHRYMEKMSQMFVSHNAPAGHSLTTPQGYV